MRGASRPRLPRPISRRSYEPRGSHEGVLGFDSGFEEPSKTPRTTFHGSPLDFNATCTHAYVRRFATEYAGDRGIERSLGARVISRLDIPYVLSGTLDLIEKFWVDVMFGESMEFFSLGEHRLLLFKIVVFIESLIYAKIF